MDYSSRPNSDRYEQQQTEHITKPASRWKLQVILFIATFFSVIIAGTAWQGKDFTDISNWSYGIEYALLILTFTTAHEFGHYFAARIHNIDVSLPYYIPLPLSLLGLGFLDFGTMGAVIKTYEPIQHKKVLFDIGVAGPIAGFVVCLILVVVGIYTLPSVEYLYSIHPEYQQLQQVPTYGMSFGSTLLLTLLKSIIPTQGYFPPMNEIYHYPMLCVGWFGMFVTAMNLLPLGQLDGGHILYAMAGRYQKKVGLVVIGMMVIIGLSSIFGELHAVLQEQQPDSLYMILRTGLLPILDGLYSVAPWAYSGWAGWLLWAVFAKLFFGIAHPEINDTEKIGVPRMIVGCCAFMIFVLCITLNGIYEVSGDETMPLPQNNTVVMK